MKIINNFLPNNVYKNLYDYIASENFAWFFIDKSVHDENKDHFMFCHTLFTNKVGVNSHEFNFMWPLLTHISAESPHHNLLRIKANLYTQTDTIKEFAKHEDYPDLEEYTTFVYNFDTSNGYTKFFYEDKTEIIQREANSLIMFNGKTEHFGTTQSNKKTSIVINFDFN